MISTSAVSPSSRKRVIGELTRGRDVAGQLRLVLRGGDALPPAHGLVGKILESFNRSISLLGEFPTPEMGRKPEVSGEGQKAVQKDRRGCYKRRKTSETWIKESTTLFEDGHAWRKYGQKAILHSKHPRNYFRCTHKFDEVGCQASKQVQMIRDDPPLYRTTYNGQHTCQNIVQFNMNSTSSSPHHIIVETPAEDPSSVMLSFGSSSDDANLVVVDDSFAFDAVFSSGSGGDVMSSADVISCTASTRSSMEMEEEEMMMMDSVFDDLVSNFLV